MNELRTNWQYADYRETGVRRYDDDPRILALPPLWDRNDVRKMLAHNPPFEESDRNLRSVQRIHTIKDVASLFQPLPVHLDLENHISTAIRAGLVPSNPFELGYYYKDVDTRIDLFRKNMKNGQRHVLSTHTLGGSLLGPSGCGKTSGVLNIVSLYKYPVIIHTKFNGVEFFHTQVIYLYIKCPPRSSPTSLCRSICAELDDQLGTNYVKRFCSGSRSNPDDLMATVARLMLVHSVGILVIDDIQNLTSAGSGGKEVIMNFLVNLVDTCRVACLVIGTYKALPILVEQFSQIRRNAGTSEAPFFHLLKENSPELELVIKSLWRYQYIRHPVQYTDELAHVLFEETQGVLDFIVKIYMLVQVRAILTERESFDADLIRSVAFDSLRLARETLQQLKNGHIGVLLERDIAPIDLNLHISSALRDMVPNEQVVNAFEDNGDDEIVDRSRELPLPHRTDEDKMFPLPTSGKRAPKKNSKTPENVDTLEDAVKRAGYTNSSTSKGKKGS